MRLNCGYSVLSEHVGQTSIVKLLNGSSIGNAEPFVTAWLFVQSCSVSFYLRPHVSRSLCGSSSRGLCLAPLKPQLSLRI